MILNTLSDPDQLALSRAKASWAVNHAGFERDENIAEWIKLAVAQIMVSGLAKPAMTDPSDATMADG